MAATKKSYAGAAVQTNLTLEIAGATDAIINVAATTGYPNTTVGPFVIVVDGDSGTMEKILIASYNATTMTVATSGRGYDGTTAQGHIAGAVVNHCVDADSMTDNNVAAVAVGLMSTETPTTLAIGNAAATGASGVAADALHIHGLPAAEVTPTTSAPGDTPAQGASGLFADGLHVHGRADTLLPSVAGMIPTAPTITNVGTAGATTYSYTVTASLNGSGTEVSAVGSTTTGNATLSGTNYNLVAINPLIVPAGSPGNLVYDSNLTNAIATEGATWNMGVSPIGTANGDFNVLNPGTDSAEIVYYGTGTVGPNVTAPNPVVSVACLPGQVWTCSAYMDSTNATAGPGAQIACNGGALGEINAPLGEKGIYSFTFTVSAGTTTLDLYVNVNGSTVTAGATMSWSKIQLTQTSTVQPYQPGPLPTYNVYRGHLWIGTTTTLAVKDTVN